MLAQHARTQFHISNDTPIVAMDGKQIGTVKETRGNYLKVNARWARDYWLTTDEVLSADQDEVRLVIPSDELNLYKMYKPGAADGVKTEVDIRADRDRFDQQIYNR